ncbi:Helix-turn-helix domain-containing protein [Marinilactibacillus piezotolerans]|uniref:Helix-turn-helix domain-containing protein n=1 Tax=Marinilactibacillus piezotolerans TaxID=258723 RepID=A0A1I3UJT3_9LACT|nr:helix-turn-helix transcriptional regulator [Marinilactibacillus piezotolerans]SFJ83162.1 Helix-turn-helix domain-containing protein [Marinilactibacillus piezotolerans]
MNEAYYHLGKVLKTIRENKGYSQQEISDSTMSRSNYTKLERDEINPNVVKYLAILDYMDMHHDEYSFILNDYSLNDKDNVFYLYKKMEQFPEITYVKKLIDAANDLLESRYDHLTKDVLNIAQAYYSLMKDHNLVAARKYAESTWERLKKLDKFYLSELHLLNGILYLFEVETVVSLTDRALKDLEKYYCFKEAEELRLSYLSHLSCILIAHEEYDLALKYIDQLITKSKNDSNALSFGAALVRQGLCLQGLDKEKESQESYELAIELFRVMDREDLVKLTKENPKLLYNPYGYVDVEIKPE